MAGQKTSLLEVSADAGLPPDELELLASARFGSRWPSLLAKTMGMSRPAVSRWRREGITSPDRAAQVRSVLAGMNDGRTDAVPLPSPQEFAHWRRVNFGTVGAAASALGLDADTIRAMEAGVTRKGNPAPIRPWVSYMMRGYRAPKEKVDSRRVGSMSRGAVAKAIAAGESHADIAKKAGVSYQRIGNVAREEGLLRRIPKTEIEERKSLARIALDGGATVAEAAAQSGLSMTMIFKYQRRGHLPRSVRAMASKGSGRPRGIDKKAVVKDLEDGETPAALAKKYNVSEQRIYQIALDAGLRRRRRRRELRRLMTPIDRSS